MNNKLDTAIWVKLFYYPLLWPLAIWVAIKKGIAHLFGVSIKTNSIFVDGILSGPTSKYVKEYRKSARALAALYNYKPSKVSSLGNLLDNFWLATPNTRAVRNRKVLVVEGILEAIRDIHAKKDGTINILSLACGSAEATLEAMNTATIEGIDVHCMLVDISRRALGDAKKVAAGFGLSDRIKVKIANVTDPIVVTDIALDCEADLIEVVGLLDYLEDTEAIALFEACRQILPEYGRFFTANILPNGERLFLELVVDWKMIYRTPAELKNLLIAAGYSENEVEVEPEPFGIHAVVYAKGGGAMVPAISADFKVENSKVKAASTTIQ